MRKAIRAIALLSAVVATSSLLISTSSPSSQSADSNPVIGAFNPDADAWLRVDFLIDVPTTPLGCSNSF